jgi:hypothetical protein
MRDVQASNPQLCVRLTWPKAGGPPVDLSGRISAENSTAYDAAVARLIAENSLVQKDLRPEQRDMPVSLEAMRAGYASVREAMSARYDVAVIAKLNEAGVATLEPGLACAGSIELLARTLMLPPDVAASVMRNLIRD